MTDMPTPMTQTLAAALEDAASAISQLSRLGSGDVNDRDHYRLVQECLDELVTATLAASAASPRQRRGYTGARFDLGSKSSITPLLTEAAQHLLRGGVPSKSLSPYNSEFTRASQVHLAGLAGSLVSSIKRYAIQDLDSVRGQDVTGFIAVADRVAQAASPGETEAEPAQRREDADGTWNPAG